MNTPYKRPDANIDQGPCRISPERFAYLNKAKYQRELSQIEVADYLSFMFYQAFGYNLDLISPCTFNEKLNWLKVFHHDKLMNMCADKAQAQNFIRSRLPDMGGHCVDILGVYHKPDELDLDVLPDRFVLKSNFGSGMQVFVEKDKVNPKELMATISTWLDPRKNHYYSALENSYKGIVPAVVCEPIISFDYEIKFLCFDGEPFAYMIITNAKTEEERANIYTLDGCRLPVNYPPYRKNFEPDLRPPYFDELVEAARTLSAGFPHVRVDFYAAVDTWFFGELTFFTWAGMTPFSAYEIDVLLGRQIKLEKLRPTCA